MEFQKKTKYSRPRRKWKELSPMFLMGTRRFFAPMYRLIEIQKTRYGNSDLEDKIEDFIKKYFVKDLKRYRSGYHSKYGGVKRSIYKKLIPLYQEVLVEKLLLGDSVALPNGLGTATIYDMSDYSGVYKIAYKGQYPMILIQSIPSNTRRRMEAAGYDSIGMEIKPYMKQRILEAINKKGVKYRKLRKKVEHGKYEIHQPPSHSYITGESLQREAVQ